MKKKIPFLFLFLLNAGISMVDCDNPTASGTIQVNDTYSGGCLVVANLDGAGSVTVLGSYNFTSVSPGVHTLNLSTSGSISAGNCGFSNNSTTTSSCSVTVKAGTLFAATLSSNGSPNAAVIEVSCP